MRPHLFLWQPVVETIREKGCLRASFDLSNLLSVPFHEVRWTLPRDDPHFSLCLSVSRQVKPNEKEEKLVCFRLTIDYLMSITLFLRRPVLSHLFPCFRLCFASSFFQV